MRVSSDDSTVNSNHIYPELHESAQYLLPIGLCWMWGLLNFNNTVELGNKELFGQTKIVP